MSSRLKQPKGENVKYTKGNYLVLQTSGLPVYQVYKRTGLFGDTQTYTRQPDYSKTGTIKWFKTIKSARDYINAEL